MVLKSLKFELAKPAGTLRNYVSPVCQGTHAASENKTLSLFLRSQISKNGATTELIQICSRYDVISAMQTHSTIRNVAIRNNAQLFWT